jgi:saccharopine dehydrogenase-like NADP-dependent oxidoreductase
MSDSARVVTVLGGYGIFGGRVAEALARDGICRVRVVGRSAKIGRNFAHRVGADFYPSLLDDSDGLRRAIEGSFLVIHAAGPFQGADYHVAEQCIKAGAHYLDLSDAREFVAGIGRLDDDARRRRLLVASGVSSTPAITSAMIAELVPEFGRIDEIHTALSPGNQNPRGAATIAAVLSYLGRTIRVWRDGQWVERPGWGDARRRAQLGGGRAGPEDLDRWPPAHRGISIYRTGVAQRALGLPSPAGNLVCAGRRIGVVHPAGIIARNNLECRNPPGSSRSR